MVKFGICLCSIRLTRCKLDESYLDSCKHGGEERYHFLFLYISQYRLAQTSQHALISCATKLAILSNSVTTSLKVLFDNYFIESGFLTFFLSLLSFLITEFYPGGNINIIMAF